MAEAQLDPQTQLENAPLYTDREPIYAKSVKGPFRRLKWILMTLMLGVYYFTPWIRWDRGPAMPDQAVLVDLANRRFFFFWIEIWPQEFYYIAGLLIMAGLGLFLFTSVLGRVWCGYGCPQTVWVDLFLHVERAIEGDRNNQIRLHRAPWGAKKLAIKLSKWSIFLLISLATGGAWIFYFADAPTLAADFMAGAASSYAYITVAVLTTTTFLLGGFAREQVCIYMCPWPRIQGAMLDPNSLTVTYKDWRGEPRKRGKRAKAAAEGATALAFSAGGAPDAGAGVAAAPKIGDCVDCNACVNVCPMGIDIRDGQQLECITCALCIDACDDVMKKLGKPRGLIDYATLRDCETEAAGGTAPPLWRTIVRPRTLLYFTLWAGIGVAMVVTLFMRDSIDLNVLKQRNPTYVTMSDGSVRNTYTVKILNMNPEAYDFRMDLEGPAGLSFEIQRADPAEIPVAADKLRKLTVFVTLEPGAHFEQERTPLRFWIENLSTRERTSYSSTFTYPAADAAP